jgi:hypothetical protein
MTSCHYSQLTSLAFNSGCGQIYNNLLKFFGQKLIQNVHPEFLLQLSKATGKFVVLASTKETQIIKNVKSILIQAATSM